MTKAEAIKWLSEMVANCATATQYNDPHRAEKMKALKIAIQSLEGSEDNGEA